MPHVPAAGQPKTDAKVIGLQQATVAIGRARTMKDGTLLAVTVPPKTTDLKNAVKDSPEAIFLADIEAAVAKLAKAKAE